MKKTALYLICITPILCNVSAETFDFRDGSTVKGEIYWEKGYEPNSKGIILSVNKKLYFHHYPYVKGSSCSPPIGFPYYAGRNPLLPLGHVHRSNFRGYSTTVTCVPSRISFFNFPTYTLNGIKERVANSRMSIASKLETIKMINHAMSHDKPKYMIPSAQKTRKWQSHMRTYGNWHFKKGTAVWGRDLADSSFKNVNLINGSP
jgi:hypothetical protein